MNLNRVLDEIGIRNMWRYPRPPVEGTPEDAKQMIASPLEKLHVPVVAPEFTWTDSTIDDGLSKERFTFPSQRPSGHERVDVAQCIRWSRKSCKAAGRNAVVLVHGAYASSLSRPMLFIPRVREAEWDTIALELPHHMHRQRADSEYSGAHMVTGDPVRITNSILQSDADIRALVLGLRETGYERIVVGGASIGASPTMQAIVGVKVEGAFGLVPSVDAYVGLWTSLLGRSLRPVGHAAGFTDELARDVLGIITPARVGLPMTDPDRILLYYGIHDRVCVPAESHDLSRAWGGCHLHAISAGHASVIMFHPRVRRLLGAWIARCMSMPTTS